MLTKGMPSRLVEIDFKTTDYTPLDLDTQRGLFTAGNLLSLVSDGFGSPGISLARLTLGFIERTAIRLYSRIYLPSHYFISFLDLSTPDELSRTGADWPIL